MHRLLCLLGLLAAAPFAHASADAVPVGTSPEEPPAAVSTISVPMTVLQPAKVSPPIDPYADAEPNGNDTAVTVPLPPQLIEPNGDNGTVLPRPISK